MSDPKLLKRPPSSAGFIRFSNSRTPGSEKKKKDKDVDSSFLTSLLSSSTTSLESFSNSQHSLATDDRRHRFTRHACYSPIPENQSTFKPRKSKIRFPFRLQKSKDDLVPKEKRASYCSDTELDFEDFFPKYEFKRRGSDTSHVKTSTSLDSDLFSHDQFSHVQAPVDHSFDRKLSTESNRSLKRNAIMLGSGSPEYLSLESEEIVTDNKSSGANESLHITDEDSETEATFPKKYCIRIFRPDSSFATISCSIKAKVSEVRLLLAKKFFINDISWYDLYLRRKGQDRVLGLDECPVLLMKQMLEKMGYTQRDRLYLIGREDNSYYFRFILNISQPSTIINQTEIQDYRHVDLRSKNLKKLPVSVINRCNEVLSLRLGQNLMIDYSSNMFEKFNSLTELRLTDCELYSLPKCLSYLCQLKILDISGNKLQELDSLCIQKLTGLTNLFLSNNQLESFQSSIRCLINLLSLDASNNKFADFPVDICYLPELSDLDLSFNQIRQIPSDIIHAKRLSIMLLRANKLHGTLPTELSGLHNLSELDLRNNSISNLDILSNIPHLKCLRCQNNSVSTVKIEFNALRDVDLGKNSITQILLPKLPVSTLIHLNLCGCKLVTLPDDLFCYYENLESLKVQNNHLVHLPKSISYLQNLKILNCANNVLSNLPAEISSLKRLELLDVHENNLKAIPQEIWQLAKLVKLNASSNLLESFPRPKVSITPSAYDVDNLSVIEQFPLSVSLKEIILSDNRLNEDVFPALSFLVELRILNLSYNNLDDIPSGGLINQVHLVELFLSGNQITSFPSEEIERLRNLQILHLNCNKLQTLPAELGKIGKLHILDVGSNSLKYNICNWPYDWNWNWNLELRYLNLSGNKRLVIRPNPCDNSSSKSRNLSDFSTLKKLQVLGLMDVTVMVQLPEEKHDRRVRISETDAMNISYGLAESIGKSKRSNTLWTCDMAFSNFQEKKDCWLFVLFDGRTSTHNGSQITKYLCDWFTPQFAAEINKNQNIPNGTQEALRKTFLNLNKQLGTTLKGQCGKIGATATIVYIEGTTLYVANVGDVAAVLSKNGGTAHLITTCHTLWNPEEIVRLKDSEGYVTNEGQLNGTLDVSRAFGHFDFLPTINASPSINQICITEYDEFVIIATKTLWDQMSHQTAIDIARTERDDLLVAAQKVRDFAIAYGAQDDIVVMIIGINELFEGHMPKARTYSKNIPLLTGERPVTGWNDILADDGSLGLAWKRNRRLKDAPPQDSTLARLDKEVEPPTGEVALVFTDIKNSTFLWETLPTAMRSAIKIHNSIMRRALRNIGGYEVKTEGDAFMVSFRNVTSALLWCLTTQVQLMQADWPQEILACEDGQEVYNPKLSDELLLRGLSVRMGLHLGTPECEPDPITRRMDYFGPMVNRSARICGAADGGQICISSDVVAAIQSIQSVLNLENDSSDQKVPRDVRLLKKIGFIVVELGERKLKGLETVEKLSLAYPKSLYGRLDLTNLKKIKLQTVYEPQPTETIKSLEPSQMQTLGQLCVRLENVTSGTIRSKRFSRLEFLNSFLTFLLKNETTDAQMIKLLESLVSRIENVISTLYMNRLAKLVNSTKETNGEMTYLSSAMTELLTTITEYQKQKTLIVENHR